MVLQTYPILPVLRPFVRVVWSMEGEEDNSGIFPMRILPDTCVELVIHFKDPFKTTFSDNTVSIQPQSLVVAQMKSFIEIQPYGKTGFIAVRFSAFGAYHFFGMPMKEIANGETELRLIWDALATEIQDRIYEAGTNKERSEIIQDYLLAQFSRNNFFDRSIEFCLREIDRAKGQLSIEKLAYKTGISNRQLVRRFNNTVGLSPKEFSRITKFINALDLLKRHRNLSLTKIAYDAGYYDQAHFIRDFKEYSGLTPAAYLCSENVVY